MVHQQIKRIKHSNKQGYCTLMRIITVAAERIINAAQAPFQIDSAITAMLTQKKPIYLEVWRTPCQRPQGKLQSGIKNTITISNAKEAAKATFDMMLSRPKSVFWAGVELQRYGLQDKFLELLSLLNKEQTLPDKEIHFITSPMSKSVIAETHQWFAGCVTVSNKKIDSIVGDDGLLIGLGAWTTGKDTSNQDIRSDRTVLAAHNGVHVGANYYPSVQLSDYIGELINLFQEKIDYLQQFSGCRLKDVDAKMDIQNSSNASLASNLSLDYDSFFSTMDSWITENDIMVVDAGFSLIGAQNVKIPSRNGFIAQASWLSIGYSVPAGTGIKCACPDKRAIVVGDGAFQETCQAIGDQHAYGQNTVVFVIANGIYGIEQYLVNPNPFREPPNNYNDKLLDSVYNYNVLHQWNIEKLADGFGGKGRVVNKVQELIAVMDEIRQHPNDNFLVEVRVPQTSVPRAIAEEASHAVGEDEIENKNWPPKNKF